MDAVSCGTFKTDHDSRVEGSFGEVVALHARSLAPLVKARGFGMTPMG
jgi:hypothetical protein